MEDVRMKIVEMAAQIPAHQLDGSLEYMEAMMKLAAVDSTVSEHLSDIMTEDDSLLKRLAQ